MSEVTEYTRGVFIVHSAPGVLAPHIEWAIGALIGAPVSLLWSAQPAQHGTVRAEADWRAPIGTGSQLASALLGWRGVRFEITEYGTARTDGSRWMHTPTLGILHQHIDAAGNTVLNEVQIRDTVVRAAGDMAVLERLMERALGTRWDAELDVFRAAAYAETEDLTRVRSSVS